MTTSEIPPAAGPAAAETSGERAELVETLRKHRALFLLTCRDLDDRQARARPTVSTLTLISLVKHVSDTEASWARFARSGAMDESADHGADAPAEQAAGRAPDAEPDLTPEGSAAGGAAPAEAPEPAFWEAEDFVDPRFVVGEEETLDALVAGYEQVAAATDALVGTIDLDLSHPLPSAPWFEPGASWSARRVFLHIIAETAQHAGHADIIRETIDGQKSMG